MAVDRTVVEVQLPNGAHALVSAHGGETAATRHARRPDGAQKASAAGAASQLASLDFSEVSAMLEGLSTALRQALSNAAPDKTTVEFGLDFSVSTGKLTGLVVEGRGAGSLAITLEWDRRRAPGA